MFVCHSSLHPFLNFACFLLVFYLVCVCVALFFITFHAQTHTYCVLLWSSLFANTYPFVFEKLDVYPNARAQNMLNILQHRKIINLDFVYLKTTEVLASCLIMQVRRPKVPGLPNTLSLSHTRPVLKTRVFNSSYNDIFGHRFIIHAKSKRW